MAVNQPMGSVLASVRPGRSGVAIGGAAGAPLAIWWVLAPLALAAAPPPAPAQAPAPSPALTPTVLRSVPPLASPDPRLEAALRRLLYPVQVDDGQGHGPDPGSPEERRAEARRIERRCLAGRPPGQGSRYAYNRVDLNGDGRPEWVVSLVGPQDCGTGGCPLLIFREPLPGGRNELVLVSRMTLFKDPLVVAEGRQRGWHDLISRVRLDAGHGYAALLPFDGRGYPSNPSVPPARPLDRPVRGTAYLGWTEDPAPRHPLPCAAPGRP